MSKSSELARCTLQHVVDQLRCEYEKPDPELPGFFCTATYTCTCLSDHMGGADCWWGLFETVCPEAT